MRSFLPILTLVSVLLGVSVGAYRCATLPDDKKGSSRSAIDPPSEVMPATAKMHSQVLTIH